MTFFSVFNPIKLVLSIVFMGFILCCMSPISSSAVEMTYYVLDEKAHPFQIIEGKISVSGIITDIIEVLFRDSSHKINISVLPVLRLERQLLNRKSDYWITYGSPVWKAAVGKLSNESLFTVKHVLITHKSSDLKFRKIEDLFGKQIALLFGFDYPGLNPYLFNDYEAIKTKKITQKMKSSHKEFKIFDARPQTYDIAFKLIDNDRVAGFVEMDLRIKYNLKATGRNSVNYKFYNFSSIIAPYDIHLRMSKNLSAVIQTEVDNKIRRLKDQGEIKRMMNKYK